MGAAARVSHTFNDRSDYLQAVACTDFLKGRGENTRVLATEKGTSLHVLASKRTLYHVLTSQGGILVRFGSQEGTLVCVLAPKMALYHVLTSQGGILVCFGSQEGTLVCVLAPKMAL